MCALLVPQHSSNQCQPVPAHPSNSSSETALAPDSSSRVRESRELSSAAQLDLDLSNTSVDTPN